jgi:hypothetical protein
LQEILLTNFLIASKSNGKVFSVLTFSGHFQEKRNFTLENERMKRSVKQTLASFFSQQIHPFLKLNSRKMFCKMTENSLIFQSLMRNEVLFERFANLKMPRAIATTKFDNFCCLYINISFCNGE